jgi:hypothetical protein
LTKRLFTATKEPQNGGRLSATGIALQLVRQRGIGGLYKGTGATMARDVTFSIVYFPLFAYLNSLGPRKKDGSGEAVFWASFVAGCAAGAFGATFVTPLDGNYLVFLSRNHVNGEAPTLSRF